MEKNKKLPIMPILAALAVFAVAFLVAMGNYPVAIIVSVIAVGVVIFWQWPNLLCIRGQSEYAKGNNNNALELLKKSHESNRSKVSNSTAYAYILLRVGQDKEAEKVMNYVLLNPKLKDTEKLQARQILSLVKYKQGDFEEASRLMEMVFEGYKNSSVYGALGYYKILSNAPDMESFNEEAYEYNSEDKIIIDNVIILALKNGDYQRAKELSEKSIGAGNKGVEIFYHAGQAYKALGENDKALECFKKASSCERSFMTTITEAEIEKEINEIEKLN